MKDISRIPWDHKQGVLSRKLTRPAFEVEDLSVKFTTGDSELTVFENLNLELAIGAITAIVGASGSGKTTFLRTLGGLLEPSFGKISFFDGNGISVLEYSKKRKLMKYRQNYVAWIFQDLNLFGHLSVLDNVAFPLRVKGMSWEEARKVAEGAIDNVGMYKRMKESPRHLSGGEQQRVAIARALASDAPVILADEPTGNLDKKNSVQVLNLLQNICDKGKTVLLVTHQEELAEEFTSSLCKFEKTERGTQVSLLATIRNGGA